MDVHETVDQLYEAAADQFCDLVRSTDGVFTVALSGGSTPRRLYEMLSQRELPWERVHWFWGDERNVPHDHADSNCRMVREALLDVIGAKPGNVHPVPINQEDPAAAALEYEQTLREHFGDSAFPEWDLALQGMGDDAHTASLFPETKALEERQRWFVENWVEKLSTFRYTLTAPAINSAKQSWFLVTGAGKKAAVGHVLGKERNPARYPSQLITPTRWLLTRDVVE